MYGEREISGREPVRSIQVYVHTYAPIEYVEWARLIEEPHEWVLSESTVLA